MAPAESQTTLLLRHIGILVTLNKKLGALRDAAIYVRANQICWVGHTAELPEEYATAETVRDLPDRLMIPGLVNTHHHMFQCLTRCVAQVGHTTSSAFFPIFLWKLLLILQTRFAACKPYPEQFG